MSDNGIRCLLSPPLMLSKVPTGLLAESNFFIYPVITSTYVFLGLFLMNLGSNSTEAFRDCDLSTMGNRYGPRRKSLTSPVITFTYFDRGSLLNYRYELMSPGGGEKSYILLLVLL